MSQAVSDEGPWQNMGRGGVTRIKIEVDFGGMPGEGHEELSRQSASGDAFQSVPNPAGSSPIKIRWRRKPTPGPSYTTPNDGTGNSVICSGRLSPPSKKSHPELTVPDASSEGVTSKRPVAKTDEKACNSDEDGKESHNGKEIENNVMMVPDFTLGPCKAGSAAVIPMTRTTTTREKASSKKTDTSLRTLPATFRVFIPGDMTCITFQAPVGVKDGDLIFGSQDLTKSGTGAGVTSSGNLTTAVGAIKPKASIEGGLPPPAVVPSITPIILPQPHEEQRSRKKQKTSSDGVEEQSNSPVQLTRDLEPWLTEGTLPYNNPDIEINVESDEAGGSAASGLNRRRVTKMYAIVNHPTMERVAYFCGKGATKPVVEDMEPPNTWDRCVLRKPGTFHPSGIEASTVGNAEELEPEGSDKRNAFQPRRRANHSQYQVYQMEPSPHKPREVVSGIVEEALTSAGGTVKKTADGFTVVKDPKKVAIRKGIPWIEMSKVLTCRLCSHTFKTMLKTCRHLLEVHREYASELAQFLSKQKVPNSVKDETLSDLVLQNCRTPQEVKDCKELLTPASGNPPISSNSSLTDNRVDFEGVTMPYDTERYGSLLGLGQEMEALSSQSLIEDILRNAEDQASADYGHTPPDRTEEEGAEAKALCPQASNNPSAPTSAFEQPMPNGGTQLPARDRSSATFSNQTRVLNGDPEKEVAHLTERRNEEGNIPSAKDALSTNRVGHEQFLLQAGEKLVPILQQYVKITADCPRCHLRVNRMRFMALHSCVRTTKHALCEICGNLYSFSSFRTHYRQTHSESQIVQCKYCDKKISETSIHKHVQLMHLNKSPISCVICNAKLTSRAHLRRHEQIHSRVTEYKCDYCYRSFNQQTNLKAHMRQHTGERPYQCEQCEKDFTHKVSLKTHLKKQHGIDLWKEGQTGGGRSKRKKKGPILET